MTIECDTQAGMVQGLVEFCKRHRAKQMLIDLAEILDEKDRRIDELESEIRDLEQDLRVTKDLLTIAGAIDDSK